MPADARPSPSRGDSSWPIELQGDDRCVTTRIQSVSIQQRIHYGDGPIQVRIRGIGRNGNRRTAASRGIRHAGLKFADQRFAHSPCARAECSPNPEVDILIDRPSGTVHEERLHNAGVIAP